MSAFASRCELLGNDMRKERQYFFAILCKKFAFFFRAHSSITSFSHTYASVSSAANLVAISIRSVSIPARTTKFPRAVFRIFFFEHARFHPSIK